MLVERLSVGESWKSWGRKGWWWLRSRSWLRNLLLGLAVLGHLTCCLPSFLEYLIENAKSKKIRYIGILTETKQEVISSIKSVIN